MTEGIPASGAVKWFNTSKGYGFITRADGAGDVFFHATDAKKCGLDEKTIDEGQKYSFVILDTPRGIKAAQLARLPD
jgi:CspA family cold shock protein